jgi:hypothetical protein
MAEAKSTASSRFSTPARSRILGAKLMMLVLQQA